MSQIKLFHHETYPDTVAKVREKLQVLPVDVKSELRATEFLCDYWQITSGVNCTFEPREIVAYHNTRLPDKKSIENHGLIFSDDRYTNILRASLQGTDIEQLLIDEVY